MLIPVTVLFSSSILQVKDSAILDPEYEATAAVAVTELALKNGWTPREKICRIYVGTILVQVYIELFTCEFRHAVPNTFADMPVISEVKILDFLIFSPSRHATMPSRGPWSSCTRCPGSGVRLRGFNSLSSDGRLCSPEIRVSAAKLC